jgi:hypothetical protein
MEPKKEIFTDLTVAHAGLQAQPKLIEKLNEQEIAPFMSSLDRTDSPAGYQVLVTGYAAYILEREQKEDTYQDLDDLIRSLRAIPRGHKTKQLKGSVSIFKVSNRNYCLHYRIGSGQIIVYNIEPEDKLQKARDKKEQTAVYHVKRNEQGLWDITAKVEKIKTAYAAVNGQSNNLTKATWLMGQHLDFQYKNVSEYTLFHNPSIGGAGDTWESLRDKLGFTTKVTKQFSELLLDAQAEGNATRWVAHSQGGAIFAEGVRYILNGNSSSALRKLQFNGARNPEKGSILNQHTVAFHGNANNNIRTGILMKRAGITVVPGQATDYDFVRNIIGLNTLNPRKLVGSILYANHVFSGSINQSSHTLAQTQDQWQANMDNGPGKGRGRIQRLFNKIDGKKKETKIIPNYLP